VKDEFCRGKTTRGFDGQNAETDKLFQAQLFLPQPPGVELNGQALFFSQVGMLGGPAPMRRSAASDRSGA
jgi:hypothetical protein